MLILSPDKNKTKSLLVFTDCVLFKLKFPHKNNFDVCMSLIKVKDLFMILKKGARKCHKKTKKYFSISFYHKK